MKNAVGLRMCAFAAARGPDSVWPRSFARCDPAEANMQKPGCLCIRVFAVLRNTDLLRGVESEQYKCSVFQVSTQNQIEAQRSGFDLERRSSGMSAL